MSRPASRIVVAGFGAAAHRLVERLRHHGHDGPVTVLGAEPHPAHQRGLLPAVLTGPLPAAATRLPDPPDDVEVRLGVRVTGVDRDARVVVDERGREYGYDELVVATGAAPRDGGLTGSGVRSLYTLDDVAAPLSGDVVVVGAGPRGVELAAMLVGPGRRVALVGAHERVLPRRLDDRAADVVADALRARGVRLHLGRRALAHRGGVLHLEGGTTVDAPELVVTAGHEPTGVAGIVGLGALTTDRAGVRVDDRLATDDPRVHALGAVAVIPGTDPGHLGSAWEQADVLARRLTGADVRYRPTRTVTRLRVGDLEVLAAGTPATGRTRVTAADATRYARLDLDDDGCLVHAGVVGFPGAAGPLTRYWAQHAPLPTARLALLLGVPPSEGDGELGDDDVVCVCNTVTVAQVRAADASDVATVAARTRATTGCGTCTPTVRCLLARFATEEVDA